MRIFSNCALRCLQLLYKRCEGSPSLKVRLHVVSALSGRFCPVRIACTEVELHEPSLKRLVCGVSDSLGCVSRRDIFAGMKVSSLLYTQVRLPTEYILVLRNFFANLIQYVSVALLVVNIINPRRACAGGLRYLSCVCVCLCVCLLQLQRQQRSFLRSK